MKKQKRGLGKIARGQGWPGTGRDGCGAGGCRDGKEVVVVGVTSGRASAGARASRERGRSESSRDGDGDGEEALEGEEAEGKGPVWGRGGRRAPGAAVCRETPVLGAQPTPKCCWIRFTLLPKAISKKGCLFCCFFFLIKSPPPVNKSKTNNRKKRGRVISSRWLAMTGTFIPVHPYLTAFALGGAPRSAALASRTIAARLEAPIRECRQQRRELL